MKKYLLCFFVLCFCPLFLTAAGGQEDQAATRESIGFNETGYPIVSGDVTLNAAVMLKPLESKKRNDLWLFQELQRMTNVKIAFDAYPSDGWIEKKNLLIASGDLPDMFWGAWIIEDRECLAFGLQGVIIHIEDLIPKYNPNLEEILRANPGYRSTITTPDGHIYGYPNITEPVSGRVGACFFMNDDWFAQLGMEAPKTTDELYTVLKAFKENDLNGNGEADEIPLTFTKFGGNDGIVALFGMFGLNIYHNTAIYVKDGEVHFGAMEENYKEAISYLHKLYSEGLIDLEVFTQTPPVAQAKSRDNSRVGAFIGWSSTWMTGKVDNPYSAILPPSAPGKEAVWPVRTMGGPRPLIAVGITPACEYPEVAARWADTFYDQDMAVQAVSGPFDILLKRDENGMFYYDESVENPGVEKLNYVPAFTFAPTLREINERFLPNPNRESKKDLDEIYLPYLIHDNFPTLYMTEEETEIVDELREDFKIFYQEQCAKWVVNGGIEGEWDSYIRQLKAMGIEEMLASYQSAYDRFLGK